MPGIELLDYTRRPHITSEERDQIIKAVHDVLADFNGKRPEHTTFKYSPAGHLDVSCFDRGNDTDLDTDGYHYILVVDGEKTTMTLELKKEIREAIKQKAAGILEISMDTIAVRYRVYDSSFG